MRMVGTRWQWLWRKTWERIVLLWRNGASRRYLWRLSLANTGVDITQQKEFIEADVVHLHWVNHGLLSFQELERIVRSGKPLVWTLHDMWPMTGLCHHAYDCTRYQKMCCECPLLQHPATPDLSSVVFAHKLATYGLAFRMKLIAVSQWLAERARTSPLLAGKDIQVIANALPLSSFHLLERTESRSKLGIALDKHVLVFGAARIDDPIKGFPLLKEALQLLVARQPKHKDQLHLLLFGHLKDTEALHDLPIAHTYVGVVRSTAQLSQLYSAANLTINSSYYETFGQTLAEALACGCPVAAFEGSGTTDIVRHEHNGFLAKRLDIASLAEAILWSQNQGMQLDRSALRQEVLERFSPQHIAHQHIALYQSLL